MLAKINLKTACNCTQSFYHKVEYVPREFNMPIKATAIPWEAGRLAPMDVYRLRNFKVVRWEWKSSRRVEVWYEEEVYG